jgi:hypothetical protein
VRHCWLRQFSDRPCEGPAVHKHHLILQQTIRRAYGRKTKVPASVLWDERIWVRACKGHHDAVHAGRLRVPFEALPEGVLAFAAEHELTWWLQKRFGSDRVAA